MPLIKIKIPDTNELTYNISNFTPEDNFLMLEIGSRFVSEGTKCVTPIIMEDIIAEKHKEIEILKKELESYKNFQDVNLENLVKIKLENKDLLIEDLKKQNTELLNSLENKKNECSQFKQQISLQITKELEQKNELFITKIQKEMEFFSKERERNEKSIEKLQEIIQISSSKSSVKLGMVGEQIFAELVQRAFRDFDNFYCKYTGDQTSKGDYHLFFKDFSVLVDTKNYSGNVGNSSKKKFRYDIENNKHMKIAWLISLNSSIDSFDKYPIMIEVVNDQYIFYVNNLMKYEEPVEMLRLIWSFSNSINSILSKNDVNEEDFKHYKYKIQSIVKELEKITKEENLLIIEMTKNLEKMRKNKQNTKNFLSELLNDHVNEEINIEYQAVLQEQMIDVVRNWCNAKLSIDSSSETVAKMKYSEIWDKFDKDIQNKRYNIKKLKFKEYITEIYKENYKNNEIVGINWRTDP